jgi:hypothetical protein
MQISTPMASMSRSFSSSHNMAEIAARVVHELKLDSPESPNLDYWDNEYYVDKNTHHSHGDDKQNHEEEEEEIEDDFEFPFVCRETDSSPIPADEIFYNGQIKPIYPLFDTTLLSDVDLNQNQSSPPVVNKRRSPLKKLLIEDRETTSSSSSEADDLEPGSFCVWTPKKEDEKGKCKIKSHSTGLSSSSKRWKFKHLLYNRSNSDGKNKFVFIKAKAAENNKREEMDRKEEINGMKSNRGPEEHEYVFA